jgi:replication factor C subunit 3/5
MALWVDKYRPKTLDQLDHYPAVTEQLMTLAKGGDVPHLLFYGPPGVGKRTRAMALLAELYGHHNTEKVKIDQKTLETSSGRRVDIHLISGMYHVELNPSDVGYFDRIVIQEIIKELAQTQQISINAPREYKIVVIHEADHLTREAQHALRRTMEKYMSNLRLFLICNHLGKMIEPLQSRCILIRIPAPSKDDMERILLNTMAKHGNEATATNGNIAAKNVAKDSQGNLRKALLKFQLAIDPSISSNAHESLNSISPKADWEEYIDQLVQFIIQEQSPNRLAAVRAKLYELITHCIPPTTILKHLTFGLIQCVEEPLKVSLIECAAIYEARMIQGAKAIFHLEAFVARFMSTYKRYLLNLNL